jgi:hypothetical protein
VHSISLLYFAEAKAGSKEGSVSGLTVMPATLSSCVSLALVLLLTMHLAPAASQTLLSASAGLYPRAVELADGTLLASVVAFTADGAGIGQIYQSSDQGQTFQPLSAIVDPEGAKGLCCATLYRVPRTLSPTLQAGTLLWAGSFALSARPMGIRAWASRDHGLTWTFLSTIATTATALGLWEPEFFLAPTADVLDCYYSDETLQPVYSQVLARVSSPNGTVWSPRELIVTGGGNPLLRPGMANVRELHPGALYVLSHELCGVTHCPVHLRNSTDGRQWGPAAAVDAPVRSNDGLFPAHTPVIAVVPARPTTTAAAAVQPARLLLASQMVYDVATGGIAPSSGHACFVATEPCGPSRGWQRRQAPVGWDVTPPEWWCPNYSPALLVFANGTRLLEISTRNSTTGGVCQAWFGVVTLD